MGCSLLPPLQEFGRISESQPKAVLFFSSINEAFSASFPDLDGCNLQRLILL